MLARTVASAIRRLGYTDNPVSSHSNHEWQWRDSSGGRNPHEEVYAGCPADWGIHGRECGHEREWRVVPGAVHVVEPGLHAEPVRPLARHPDRCPAALAAAPTGCLRCRRPRWALRSDRKLRRRTHTAVLRDRPYTGFNFLVDLGDGVTDGPRAGFQEVSVLGMEVTVVEYRNGNAKENNPI